MFLQKKNVCDFFIKLDKLEMFCKLYNLIKSFDYNNLNYFF